MKRMTVEERQAKIAEFADAREKMTDEERQAEIVGIRKELGILPRKPPDVDEGPYEADTAEETDTTKQADAPTPKDTMSIDSGNDNDNEDEEDDNTLHPRIEMKQGCENRMEKPIFSKDSDDDHDDNDHDYHYSESSDYESKKKKIPRSTPKST